MRTALLLAFVASTAGGCYSLTAQDRGDLQVAEQESAAAYCRLARVDGGPDVAAARALQRGSHANLFRVLQRSGADAGAPELGVACP